MLPPPPRPSRLPLRVGFKTGMAVGVVLVSAIRGCAFDIAEIARSVNDAPHAQVASTGTTPAIDDPPAPAAIPTANVDSLPRAAVRVEDLPRSRTR